MPTLGDPKYEIKWDKVDQHDHQSGRGYNIPAHTITSGSIANGTITTSGNTLNSPYQWNYGQWQQSQFPPVELPPQTAEEVEAKMEALRIQMEELDQTYREMIRVERGIVSRECSNCELERDHDPDDYICLGCREAE